MTSEQVNELKILAKSTPLAKAVFKSLSSRERPRAITDLRRFKMLVSDEHGIAVNTPAMLSIFKALEKMKLGELRMPKQDIDPPRFNWKVNYIHVGCAALGKPKPASASPSSKTRFLLDYNGGGATVILPEEWPTKECAEAAKVLVEAFLGKPSK